MKNISKILVLAVIAVIALSGCMTQFSASNGQLGYGSFEGENRGPIEVSQGYIYVLHPDILTFGPKYWEQLERLIGPELTGGANAVTDSEIRYGYTFLDLVLSGIVPVVQWGTIEITGTAVEM
jgi:hypothetical protein